MKYRVVVFQDEEGTYIAKVPSLVGCLSQGATREEAVANIRDAIRGYQANRYKHFEPLVPYDEGEELEIDA